jgi:integrase
VLEFCGWEPIQELIKYAGSPRNEIYLTSLIKTGGRAGEVLGLKKENFTVNKRKKFILVSNMKLEKRWKKIKNPERFNTLTNKIIGDLSELEKAVSE